jgi:hypothetical protein
MVSNLALFCLATLLATFQKIGQFFPNHLSPWSQYLFSFLIGLKVFPEQQVVLSQLSTVNALNLLHFVTDTPDPRSFETFYVRNL